MSEIDATFRVESSIVTYPLPLTSNEFLHLLFSTSRKSFPDLICEWHKHVELNLEVHLVHSPQCLMSSLPRECGYPHICQIPIALVGMPCLTGQNCSILNSVLGKTIGFLSPLTAYVGPSNTMKIIQQ